MNNKTLKFRVWDKFQKRYIYPDSPEQRHYVLTPSGEFHSLLFSGGPSKDYVVEQFTGLKDSEDKDVYEGDILQFENIGIKHFVINKKGFNCGCCGYVYGYDLDNIQIDIRYIENAAIEIMEAKIVGNINENPELLK